MPPEDGRFDMLCVWSLLRYWLSISAASTRTSGEAEENDDVGEMDGETTRPIVGVAVKGLGVEEQQEERERMTALVNQAWTNKYPYRPSPSPAASNFNLASPVHFAVITT